MWRAVWTWALVLGAAGCAADVEANPDADPPAASAGDAVDPVAAELDALRRATERFRDVNVALAEGYVRDPMNMCITSEMEGFPRQLGAMGIHFFRPDLLGLTAHHPRIDGTGMHTDFTQPAVLVYLPRADGGLELASIENLVWEKPWREAGNLGAPSFLGMEYWRMVDNPATADVDEGHGFEPHYELHLWLHVDNPAGVFSPFNPDASCEHHRAAAESE